MFYRASINGKVAHVDVPDDLNQDMATKVFEHDGIWSLDEPEKPEDYIEPEEDITFPGDEQEVETPESYNYADLLHPNLFIHQEGETYWTGDKQITVEDGMLPDMEYFSLIDEDFFEKMIYHWSKIDDYDVQSLLDVIEENKDYIVDSAFVIDILE